MRSASLVCALSVFASSLMVLGCASQGREAADDLAPRATHHEWRGPVLLRPGPVTTNLSVPTLPGYSPDLGKEVLWLSVTALMTFGIPLLDLPNVLARHRGAVVDLPPECADNWGAVVSRPAWLGPAEARHSGLELLAAAVRQDLARRGQAPAVEIEAAGAEDPRGAQALADIGQRLAAPVLAVADVSFGIESQPATCSMLMRVSARLHLEATAASGAPGAPDLGVSRTRSTPVSVIAWGKNPEVGAQALHSLLVQLGQDIVTALPAMQGD